MRFQGKHGEQAEWINFDIQVDVSDVGQLLADLRKSGYTVFSLLSDYGDTLVEGYADGTHKYF